MDLGTAPLFDLSATPADVAVEGVPVTRSRELLAAIRGRRAAIADHEIGLLREIAEWAGEHVVAEGAEASTITERGLDTGLPVAGPGAPLISDFAVMELSALVGRSLDSGRAYVGQVVELAYRLPKTWARVLQGRVPVWKALRFADTTRTLPADAAGFVDRQLAPIAHGVSWAQIDRLVEAALVRYDPAAAEEKRQQAQETRHVDIDLDRVGFDGTAEVTATLDIADALDLETAVARRAKLLGQLGCEDSLDLRRSVALGGDRPPRPRPRPPDRRPRHRGDHPHRPRPQGRADRPPQRHQRPHGRRRGRPVRQHPHPDLTGAGQGMDGHPGHQRAGAAGDRP
ncbi:hypothetical protein D0Z08_03695, partial [Nocardioides immobilis]